MSSPFWTPKRFFIGLSVALALAFLVGLYGGRRSLELPGSAARTSPSPAPQPTASEESPGVSRALNTLENRCVQDRGQISRMADHAALKVREDFGKDVSKGFMLNQLVDASAGQDNADCASLLAPLIILVGKAP